MRRQSFQNRFFNERLFVAPFGVFGHSVQAFVDRFKVGENQLRCDGLDVADRINRTGDVMNVRVLKTAHDLDDGVHFADVAEEFVAETFAFRRALHQPGDIHELDGGGNDDGGLRDPSQRRQPRVRHGHDADVRIDRAKRIIGRLRLPRAGDGVEQSGFPHVRETDNSGFEHKPFISAKLAPRKRTVKLSGGRNRHKGEGQPRGFSRMAKGKKGLKMRKIQTGELLISTPC
jgi:hypothetical protein